MARGVGAAGRQSVLNPQEDKRELKQLKAQNERLLHKVGQLTIDCDFFAQACEDAGLKVR